MKGCRDKEEDTRGKERRKRWGGHEKFREAERRSRKGGRGGKQSRKEKE